LCSAASLAVVGRWWGSFNKLNLAMDLLHGDRLFVATRYGRGPSLLA
jgi:hypothetical protein